MNGFEAKGIGVVAAALGMGMLYSYIGISPVPVNLLAIRRSHTYDRHFGTIDLPSSQG